jgi:hypothetical protein
MQNRINVTDLLSVLPEFSAVTGFVSQGSKARQTSDEFRTQCPSRITVRRDSAAVIGYKLA